MVDLLEGGVTTGKHRMDEYVARDSVTIPRYLIVFQPHFGPTGYKVTIIDSTLKIQSL